MDTVMTDEAIAGLIGQTVKITIGDRSHVGEILNAERVPSVDFDDDEILITFTDQAGLECEATYHP